MSLNLALVPVDMAELLFCCYQKLGSKTAEVLLVRLLILRAENFVSRRFTHYVYGPPCYHYFLKTKFTCNFKRLWYHL